MGYEIHCIDTGLRFVRPRAALETLQERNRVKPLFDDEDVAAAIEEATSIEEALEACCFDVECGSDGRVEKVFYEGKLLGDIEDVHRLFAILAPFVKPGSYLAFHDDEDNAWRYDFVRGRLRIREI
jgi:hypothetical protein